MLYVESHLGQLTFSLRRRESEPSQLVLLCCLALSQLFNHAKALINSVTKHMYSIYDAGHGVQWSLPVPMGHKFVAVIKRWLFDRGANVGHYITSDLSRWL